MRVFRKLRHHEGPSASEIGHSYIIVEVDMLPEASDETKGLQTESFRLNWGQGIKHGSCLTVFAGVQVPPMQITGERFERKWKGTCSGEELLDLLKKWSPREYDVNPTNRRNCH